MKILKLLELDDSEIITKKYNGKFREYPLKMLSTDKAGSYSIVRNDKTDPHMIRKHSKGAQSVDREPDDKFYYYAKWLIDNKISNICFPRIYTAKQINDSTGKYLMTYKIEKLIPIDKFSIEELYQILSNYFDMDYLIKDRRVKEFTNKYSLLEEIGWIIEQLIHGSVSLDKAVINEELANAIKLLKQFFQEFENQDILAIKDISNYDNIMFRRTGYGIQMVITDPVA